MHPLSDPASTFGFTCNSSCTEAWSYNALQNQHALFIHSTMLQNGHLRSRTESIFPWEKHSSLLQTISHWREGYPHSPHPNFDPHPFGACTSLFKPLPKLFSSHAPVCYQCTEVMSLMLLMLLLLLLLLLCVASCTSTTCYNAHVERTRRRFHVLSYIFALFYQRQASDSSIL